MRKPSLLSIALRSALIAALLVPAGTASAADTTPHGIEVRMLARINLHRARNELPPLRADFRLARAATAHARDMAERDFFSHQNPEGAGFDRRVRRAGYRWKIVGENIAAGLASPEDTVDSWMASEGHRHNMLNPSFTDAGIGYAFRADDDGRARYRHYWTLVLGGGRDSRPNDPR